MGRFLQILFGCHHRPDRSFFFRGKQFPICARCTGELVGMIGCIPLIVLWGPLDMIWCILLMLPMITDGFIQQLTAYESTNTKRFITGFLFGIALTYILIWIHIGTVHLAGLTLNKFWVHDMEKVEKAMEPFLFN